MFEKIKDFFAEKYIQKQGLELYHFKTLHILNKNFLQNYMPDIGQKLKENDKIAQGFFIGTLIYFYELSGIKTNLDNKKLKPEHLADMIHGAFYKYWNVTNKEAYDIYVKAIETHELYENKKLLGADLEKFQNGLELLKKCSGEVQIIVKKFCK